MGVRRIASGNPTLTNFAAGLTPDFASALADFLAPRVTVPATIGQYKKYDDQNSFQIYDTARAVGGKARRIEFAATDPTYNCKPQALEVTLDDSELDAEGNFSLSLLQGKTRSLISGAMLSHEDKVITAAKTHAAAAGLGGWANPDKDPVAEVDACIRNISVNSGRLPNRIAFGLIAWERFRNHPKVRARQPGAELIGLSTIQAANLFLNPGVTIKIGAISKLTVKPGQAAAKALVLQDDVFIFYGEENPSQYDPSWMKTFVGGRGGVDNVRTYRDESCRSDILAVDWSEDIQEVSSLCCNRITTSDAV